MKRIYWVGSLICITIAILNFTDAYVSDRRANAAETRAALQAEAVENTTASQLANAYESPIDFASLQQSNPDIYAWLTIPGTEVNYPLVQNQDDTFYLTRNSEGKMSEAGALFSESKYNDSTFDDPVTIIYGHNMRDGTMFGSLQKIYSNENSFSQHRDMFVYLPDSTLHFQIFAAVPCDNFHILYNYHFNNKREFNAFINTVLRARTVDTVLDSQVSVSAQDHLLILSTCLQGNRQRRFLVAAKLKDE